MAGAETKRKPSIFDVARALVGCAALAGLAYLAYEVVSIAFRLGTRIGIRSVLGLIVPIFAGSYFFVARRDVLHRIRRLPAVLRFSASLAAGALAMASLRFFLPLQPLPIAELLIASCIAVLAFTSAPVPGSNRPLAPYGVAAGMLIYFLAYGAPRILP